MQLLDDVSSFLTSPFVSRMHGMAQWAINFYTNTSFRVFQQPRLEADQLQATVLRLVVICKQTLFGSGAEVR